MAPLRHCERSPRLDCHESTKTRKRVFGFVISRFRGSTLAAFSIAFAVYAANDVEQTAQGTRPPAALVASFDGMGVGFEGPQGTAALRNPSDNSLAVGPDHIVQTVNSRMAVFTKKGSRFDATGRVLSGPVNTNAIFKGFGGACETYNNGDAVVRYDQLAGRWLLVNLQAARAATCAARDVLCRQRRRGPARPLPSLRVSTDTVSGLPAPGDLARRLLRADEHRRRCHSEARLHCGSREHAERRAGHRAVPRHRRRELPQQRRHRREGAAAGWRPERAE